MKDNYGRKIDYLRISLTDRCNLRCIYCMPEEGVPFRSHESVLRIEEIADFTRRAVKAGIRRVRLTGGEPLVRKGVVDLIREINDIPEIEDISLTTNGILLPKMASELRDAGLTRVNISLDTLDPAQFSYVTRLGKIEDVFAGIDAAFEHGFDPVKINAVAVRGLDQDFFAFAKLTLDRPLHVRFIEYMPVGESSGCSGAGWTEDDIIPASEIIERINEGAAAAGIGPLEPVDDESLPSGAGPAIYYRLPGAQGTVGFISAMSNHFCASCNRLRLTSDGKLRPCLFSDREIDVMGPIRAGDEGAVDEAIREAIGIKPDEHHEERGTERRMSQIGG
jgi:cyclic pyranopterin phosphate synthase